MGAGAAIAVGGAKAVSSKKQAGKAQDAANQSNAQAQAYSQTGIDEMIAQYGMAQGSLDEQMAFGQDMLTDWEETFGGIEDNLSQYYNNLDPVKYATSYKSNLNENIDKQMAQMNETMAATGLQTAGMKQQTAKEAAFAKATGGAQADLMAEDKVMSMKQGFLNTGSAQKTNAQNLISGSYKDKANMSSNLGTNLSNAYGGKGTMSANLGSNQMQQQQQSTKDMWDGSEMLGAGISDGFMMGGLF